MAPVPASACCGARALWSTTGDKWDLRFDQFYGRAAITLGFATHSSCSHFPMGQFRYLLWPPGQGRASQTRQYDMPVVDHTSYILNSHLLIFNTNVLQRRFKTQLWYEYMPTSWSRTFHTLPCEGEKKHFCYALLTCYEEISYEGQKPRIVLCEPNDRQNWWIYGLIIINH